MMPIKLIITVVAFIAVFLAAMGLISSYISPQDTLKRADVIIAISGGDTKARAQEAIKLYQEGWAPNIIFSGAALDPLSPSNAEVMQREAKESGVPVGVITLEEEARDTAENAENSLSILEQFKYKKVILVTSPYHQRRAYIEFKNAIGDEKVQIINHSAPDDDWNSSSWWYSPRGWWLTSSEAIKIPFSILKGQL